MHRIAKVLAVACYLVAQFLPAFLDSNERVWGLHATGLSFLFAFASPACVFGAIANASFIVSFVASFLSRKLIVTRLAWIAAGCASVSVSLLSLDTHVILKVGSLVWLTGIFLLPLSDVADTQLSNDHRDAIGSRPVPRITTPRQEQVPATDGTQAPAGV